jgi:hypothetical protein
MAAKKRNSFLTFVMLAVIGGMVAGAYYIKTELDARAQELAMLAQEEAERVHKQALFQGFEDILNGFVGDFAKRMTVYKKQRRILREITQSYNFENLEDAGQNYNLFIKEMAPMLRKASIDVMDIFPETEARILALLEGEAKEERAIIFDEWQGMKREQSAVYIRFFENEDALLQAYERLLKFYYVHANLYVVESDTGEILFARPEDEEKEKQLLARISAVKKNISTLTK